MKTLISLAALLSLSAVPAHAGLSRSAISSMTVQLFGLYVTSDPTCQTGLIATLPLTSNSQSVNFMGSPTLGTGTIPSSVNCVVAVMKNSISFGVSSGNYSTTSTGGTDGVCNAGGTFSYSPCSSTFGTSTKTVTWPAKIQADMNSAGLTMISSCGSSVTGTEIVPIFLSSNAGCTGNPTIDALLGHASCYPNPASPPSSQGDTSGGLIMNGSTAQAAYAFVVDPSGTIGNSTGTACGVIAPPRFGSRGGASVSTVVAAAGSPVISTFTTSGGVTPVAGPTGGGTAVLITGSGFDAGAQVSVNGSACGSVVVSGSGTVINCTTAAGSAGVGNVVVTNPSSGLSATQSSGFEYRSAITITGVSPTQVPNGSNQLITITGTGFRTASSLGAQAGAPYKVSIGSTISCDGSAKDAAGNTPAINAAGTTISCTVNKSGAVSGLTVTVKNYPDSVTSVGTYGGSAATGFNFY